jgi:hypothetical protein
MSPYLFGVSFKDGGIVFEFKILNGLNMSGSHHIAPTARLLEAD